uniref:UPAR/Ly6 domain-containing protein n=1 Tax=Bubo bubo TaxID=30461 RepID=A0A8C0I8S7_BUBBB
FVTGGMAIPSSIKSCLPSSICQFGPVTMNYGKVKGRSHLACCMGDDCRTTSVSLPPENNVPNGYQCPACYSVDSFQCSNEIVNCTGSETQCVDLAGLMNSGNLFHRDNIKENTYFLSHNNGNRMVQLIQCTTEMKNAPNLSCLD